MITSSKVGWGSYLDYEGPWFRGSKKITIATPESTTAHKYMSVISATEGGCYDAVNMYDRCVMTLGAIQWCDGGNYFVCDLLGAVAEKEPDVLKSFYQYTKDLGYSFMYKSSGKWRFFKNSKAAQLEVDTLTEQRELWLGGASGLKGSFTAEATKIAKQWVVEVANIWESEAACEIQEEFTLSRLPMFLTTLAKTTLFAPTAGLAYGLDEKQLEASRAAYISFAANLPGVASNQLSKHLNNAVNAKGMDFITGLLKQLTYGPGIAIYPGRYNHIRPVLESIFEIDLPDFASDLKAFSSGVQALTTSQIQNILIKLGYDLGPKGADGRLGLKTKSAIMGFQQSRGLVVDGLIGPKTMNALALLR